MTELDELMGFTNSKAEQAEAESNRPPFRTSPLEFEGQWDGEMELQERYTPNGTLISEWAFAIKDCRFIRVDPKQLGQYHDGETYYLKVGKPKNADRYANTEFGMMQASVTPKVESFGEVKGKRLHFLEKSRKPWPTAERPTYYYEVKVMGAAAPAAPTEPTETGIEAALGLLSGEGRTEDSFGLAALKTQGVNTDGPLVSMIASGKFLPAMIAAGRVTKDGEVYKLVG